MTTVLVRLGKRSYPVFIGYRILPKLSATLKKIDPSRVMILSDRSLSQARKHLMSSLSPTYPNAIEFPVQAGESLKDFQRVYPLYGKFLRAGAKRDSALLALGGGSVGDVAGFLASTYQRGIDWVGIPTTLLAQVDSAVGGKTAVNHAYGKNLIGTFCQPRAVFCDVSLLKTLPKRELISGLGEIIKYALIGDTKLMRLLEEKWKKALSGDVAVLSQLVVASVKNKAKVVSLDEFDEKGVREKLNFGHTFGHALETATSFQRYRHGEAVVWGMRFALELSKVKKCISEKSYVRASSLLRNIPLPGLPSMNGKKILQLMQMDKKVKKSKLRMVLLEGIGKATTVTDIRGQDLSLALENLRRTI